jgi:YVTN family beta-propeller protein
MIAILGAQTSAGTVVSRNHLPTEQSVGQLSYRWAFSHDSSIGEPSAQPVVPVASVQQTIDLVNGSLIPGNYRPLTCYGFQDVAVAASLQRVFVTCLFSDALIAFNESSGADLGSVQVGSSPMGIAFDAQNDRVYVAVSGGVDVVAGNTMTQVTAVPVDGSPYGIALDDSGQTLYVTDSSSGNVTVISAVSDSVVATIPLGGAAPLGIVYNSYNHDIYVAESGLSRIGVIATGNNSVIQTIDLSGQPFSLACDLNTGRVYVGMLSEQLIVISGLNQSVVATVNLTGGQVAVAVDSPAHRLYLDSSNVTVVNTTSLAVAGFIPVGSTPTGVDVNQATGRVYVADFRSSDLAVIDVGTSSVTGYFRSDPGPVGIEWNVNSKDLYVTNQASGTLVQVDGRQSTVIGSTQLEYGLAGVTADDRTGDVFVADTANDRLYEVTADGGILRSVQVGTQPLGVAFDSRNGDVYVTNYYANTVSVIDGSTGSLLDNISIPPPTGIGGGLTDVAFDPLNGYLYVSVEGCLCSTPGNVTIINGATNQIIGTIAVWYTPGPSALIIDTQNNELYVTDDFSNAVWAFNASSYQLISVTPVGATPEGIAVDSQTGDIYVTNSGSGNVSVIEPSTNAVVRSILVGSHPTGAAFDPVSGEVYIANEYSGTLSVVGIPYTISFSETGLPVGTNWSVSLAGITNSTNSSSLTFQKSDGTYNFTLVSSDTRYRAPGGIIMVEGSPVNRAVVFSEVTYNATFAESGLPAGTNWSVALNGTSSYSTAPSIVFSEPNGSYIFQVESPPGYSPAPSSGLLVVDGTNVTEQIVFSPVPSGPWTFLGLTESDWGLLLSVVIVVAAVAIFVALRRRKSQDKSPASTEPSHPPESHRP